MLVAALDNHTRVFWVTRLYGILDALELPPLLGRKLTECVAEPDVLTFAIAQVAMREEKSRVCVTFTHGTRPCDYVLEMHPVGGRQDTIVMMFGFARPSADNITHLDREVLFLLVQDCTVKRISELLGRSEAAIAVRIKRLKQRTGRTTLHGLLAYAIKQEWLS